MSTDLLTAIILAIVAFLSWIVQGQTELAFASAFVILLAYGVPAYARQGDKPASPAERWVIIGIGLVMIAAALVDAVR